MNKLKLLIVGKDTAAIQNFQSNHPFNLEDEGVDWITCENKFGIPLSKLGNLMMTLAVDEVQVFGLVHADVIFQPGDLKIFIDTAMKGKVCGLVGIELDRTYRWGKDLDGGRKEIEVSTLDSSSVFFRNDLGLKFDEETFNGFHCHVEDLCLQAHAKGIQVVVPKVKTTHIGESTIQPFWQAQYRDFRIKLGYKWMNVRFETT